MIRNKVFIDKSIFTSDVASVATLGNRGDAGGCQYVPRLRLAILLAYPWLTGSAGHLSGGQWDLMLQLFRTCDRPIGRVAHLISADISIPSWQFSDHGNAKLVSVRRGRCLRLARQGQVALGEPRL